MISLLAFLLPVAPLLALLLALLLGCYPGHETIVRISERLAARSRRHAAKSTSPVGPRWTPFRTPHGGLLLAHSLSGRAPPA